MILSRIRFENYLMNVGAKIMLTADVSPQGRSLPPGMSGCRTDGPFQFAGALPARDWVPNCHSNPITQRVRRKRQRLPPSLLIENASERVLLPSHGLCPEAYPIKASDNPEFHAGLRRSGARPGRSRRGYQSCAPTFFVRVCLD
jgi:hypothetical protein